jgi:hypothetical protein
LLAAEEVVGKQGLQVLLRERGPGRFIDNEPPELLKISAAEKIREICTVEQISLHWCLTYNEKNWNSYAGDNFPGCVSAYNAFHG